MRQFILMAAVAAFALLAPAVHAAFPDKPIEIITPWPAGTETDVSTRLVGAAMSKKLGVPVQIINKPGAGGVIGVTEFVKARPDGYTLAQGNIGPMVSQVVAGNTSYGIDDFETLGLFNMQPYLLVAKGDAPYRNMKELTAWARAHKEPAIGNFGPATVPTLSINRMAIADGWKFKGVVYSATNYTQLQAGDVDMIVVAYPVVATQLKSGQARALVALSPKRIGTLPDVPTTREAGYNFDVSIWSGLFAPKGTPPDVMKRLSDALREALADPSVKDFEQKSGIVHEYVSPAQSRRQIEADASGLKPVMDSLGLIKKK